MASCIKTDADGRIHCPRCGDSDIQIITSRIEVKEGEKVTKKRKGSTIRISEGGRDSKVILECFCSSCSTEPDAETGEVNITYYALTTTHVNGKMVIKWNV